MSEETKTADRAFAALRTVAHLDRDTDRMGSVMIANWIIQDIAAAAPEALANRDPQAGEAWRPIETHDGSIEKVLIYDPRFGVCEGLWFRSGYWRMASFTSSRIRALPTHWMPLPAAPRDEATCPECKGKGYVSHEGGDSTESVAEYEDCPACLADTKEGGAS